MDSGVKPPVYYLLRLLHPSNPPPAPSEGGYSDVECCTLITTLHIKILKQQTN